MAYLIIALIGGGLCAALAVEKNRSPLGWFFIGFLLPLIGIILMFVLPSEKHEPSRESELDAVARLAVLRDTGAITPQEYEQKKAELLARV